MPKVSKEELLQYNEELNKYYKYRRIFLAFGLVLLLGPIASIIPVTFYLVGIKNTGNLTTTISIIFTISIVSGIVLLILRSALFNQRIRNRKRIIMQAKEEYNIERMYAGEKEEEKIGL